MLTAFCCPVFDMCNDKVESSDETTGCSRSNRLRKKTSFYGPREGDRRKENKSSWENEHFLQKTVKHQREQTWLKHSNRLRCSHCFWKGVKFSKRLTRLFQWIQISLIPRVLKPERAGWRNGRGDGGEVKNTPVVVVANITGPKRLPLGKSKHNN